jgi:hypothetical protein
MKFHQKIFLIITVSIAGILIMHSCSKNDDNECKFSGSVIGRNLEKCGCCPGWLIKIDDDTLKFLSVPNEDLLCDLVNFYGYPIPIEFDYKDDNSSCFYKIMTCIDFSSSYVPDK